MTEFKESSTGFNTFHSAYRSADEIIYDHYIDVYAFAADMSRPDFINLQVKTLNTVQGILQQPVVLTIDGESVGLQHPETQKPLMYQDFLVARSGPLFAGYPDDGIGLEYLHSSTSLSTRQEIVTQQVQAAKDFCLNQGLPVTPEVEDKIATAASVFMRPHALQRTLGDYDLTARQIDTLCESIAQEVEKRLKSPHLEKFQSSPEFRREIGMVAWQEGGKIDTTLIESVLDSHEKGEIRSYREEAKAAMGSPKSEQYTHMLMEGPGRAVVGLGAQSLPNRDHTMKADNTYGLGIEVSAPVYYEENFRYGPMQEHEGGVKFSLATGKRGMTSDRHEHGDVICDATSTFAHAFSTNQSFSETAHKCEETAKKLAQGELFKVKGNMGKLHGNISDVTQHLQGLQATIDNPQTSPAHKAEAQALQSVVQLSLLIALPRWGITPDNLHTVGNLSASVKPQDFHADLNGRSYRHPEAQGQSARERMGWTNLSQDATDRMLAGFHAATAPISDYVKQNGEYFSLVANVRAAVEARDAYKGADKATIERLAGDVTKHTAAVAGFMTHEVDKHPQLRDTLNEHDARGVEKFAERAAQQVQESVEFGLKREGLAQAQAQKAAQQHKPEPDKTKGGEVSAEAPQPKPQNVRIRSTEGISDIMAAMKESRKVSGEGIAAHLKMFQQKAVSSKEQATPVPPIVIETTVEARKAQLAVRAEPEKPTQSVLDASVPSVEARKAQLGVRPEAPVPNTNAPVEKGSKVSELMKKFQGEMSDVVSTLQKAKVSGVTDADKTPGNVTGRNATMPDTKGKDGNTR